MRRPVASRIIGGAVFGAAAGAVGTVAMDLELYRRYRHAGGKDSLWRWEFAGSVMGWDQASAPGKIGQKLEGLVLRRPVPDSWARATTNAVHWSTGIGWGLQYGLLASRPSRHRMIRALALGPVAWLSSYVILPLTGVYEPIWKYDAKTLGKDLSAHLVFGAATSASLAALTRKQP